MLIYKDCKSVGFEYDKKGVVHYEIQPKSILKFRRPNASINRVREIEPGLKSAALIDEIFSSCIYPVNIRVSGLLMKFTELVWTPISATDKAAMIQS